MNTNCGERDLPADKQTAWSRRAFLNGEELAVDAISEAANYDKAVVVFYGDFSTQ